MARTQSNDTPGSLSTYNGSVSAGEPSLVEKLEAGVARIGIIGLGYVGLPLAIEYADRGFECIGFDVDEKRVGQINQGENYIEDIDDDRIQKAVAEDRLWATTEDAPAEAVDVFFICVPTPVSDHKEPDSSYIESAARMIAGYLRPGQLIIGRSTTFPETTENLVRPILEEAGEEKRLELGQDYFLGYSPERIDPGNETYTTANTPVVGSGVTEACAERVHLALGKVMSDVRMVSNPKVAEMEKLLENVFRSVNIALVNELAQLCERMDDVSIWEVIDAAATKPFGYMPFYPGPGLGGHCIPIDPHYLSWLAEKYDFETSFITLSARVNEDMPYHVCQSVVEAIANQPVSIGDATVLVLGVAFKANVQDTRRSPARAIVRLLDEKGVGTLQYHDPHVSGFSVEDGSGRTVETNPVGLTAETLQQCDVAVIATAHDAFDADLIAENAPAIVDARNALSEVEDPDLREKIRLLGEG
ncbi:nucleotide sugar dehydrogenase [Salinibacter ruber]|uniref:nucleotide sugar dehydrogenase n=1 Tax=Salinibacter ruber TaxID=146919 RepID=UPI00216888AB|nr:nucleotide sugar dehydrogenase [Salinibacter ruber]MCS4049246.1 UDP-N-acetyl-D-glucosamine dehydrogenase [Salinibacter ruber]